MPRILFPLALAALALGSAAPAVLAAGSQAGGGVDRPGCELRLASRGNALTLTALARAGEDAAGHYALSVTGPGTSIRQNGPFRIGPDGTATLGTVGLTAGGGGFDARLEVDLGGRTQSCTRRVPGGI
ncbi:curli-like amyloid fiber formation chaperone CsgH [Aureimonas jatrophae]|uniref:CsgH-like domain-containing protein n=1 Tax=Aureimonas jatrophae TaxID=1166073 RepID=A0A1H0HT29_9HYPH|nr:curli-like amyloid fiber formation chaperone CsgH [Aureimonas jatrophae]MBB3950764.1 hypothetical protein [Aureimonas jatrophae]SDO22365.1 hypothetical protein SAMN05192530_104271 [Aureimonas jatrophae]